MRVDSDVGERLDTHSSRKEYERSKLRPSTSEVGTAREYVMVLPGSMNIAPPPETRRTTSMPCRCAPSGSTSLRTDWNEPMTTSGLSQSQKRSVGRPLPRGDLAGDDLVEGDVQRRVQHASRDDVEVVVVPPRRLAEGAADRDADRLGREADERHVVGESAGDRPGQLLDTGVDGHPRQRRVDVAERLVGLEEEVSGHADSREPAVHLLEVDRHELATGNLVLTAHATTTTRVMPGVRRSAGTPAVASARSAPSNHGSLAAT